MRFRILGPLEITGDPDPGSAGPRPLGAPKPRTVLGALLTRPGGVVSVDELIDELWPDGPPRTALTTLHVYVSQIRKTLAAASPREGRALLVTQRPGYVLRVDPEDMDATVFERLRGPARRALAEGDVGRAAELARRADALWRGPLLAGTPHGPLLRAAAARLTEVRLEVTELRLEAELRLGHHHEVLPDLRALTTRHPLREEFHAQLLTALAHTGRHAEALEAYARLRGLLAEELGTEPGARLRALHQRLLREGGAEDGVPEPPVRTLPGPREWPPPVPPALDGELIGRDEESETVERLVRGAAPGAWTAVTGPVGAGKTALALAVAHRVADAFPDGVLFVDLRPTAGPRTAPEAAAQLLRLARSGPTGAAGPAPDRPGPDPVAALRALTARRRLLLVLDGAGSLAQVRPLLPTAPGSTALVTGRLAAAGARVVPLGPLGRLAVRRMLPGVPPDIADRVGELCGGLPLPLRAAALALTARPHWDGVTLLARLREEATRLDVLGAGEPDVRARLLGAYDELPAEQRRALRLLALLPRGEFGSGAAAAVLDLGRHPATLLLDALADRQFLLAHGPETYLLPEPARLLAADRLRTLEPTDSVRAATVRMCEAYAAAAAAPGGAPRTVARTRELAGVLRTAHAAGRWSTVLRLAEALTAPLERTADWATWETAHTLALDAAERLGDRRARARLLTSLGDLAWQQRDDERAAERYGRAAEIAAGPGLADERARALAGLAELRLEHGDPDRAAALLGVAPESGGAVGRYEVQRVRALVALQTGGGRAAAGPLTECVTLAAALGDRRREAHAHRALGAVHEPRRSTEAHRNFEVRPGVWRLAPPGRPGPPRP
ncbi:BTAD domain-containing putative transcriptional regulator [Streptomyces murinus]|uniref:AfsR/SARP family transcriptional regulator n=1 Tax=Streptomyces murinus TaxID=33900 RepID=UPI000A38F42F|nr:BTAD domain-containing putative transcriptional regulator [Streptomyces murinus]